MKFENEPDKVFEEYECMNGSLPGTERGSFKVPEENFWPRCLTGTVCSLFSVNKFLLNAQAGSQT